MNLDRVGISLEQDARGLYSRSTIIYNYIYINIIFDIYITYTQLYTYIHT